MEKLPEDLKMEFLLHLPVKSLLLCKCLSKSWFSLISNPNFINLHFQRSSSQHSHRFLYITPSQICSVDINASFIDRSATIKLAGFPLLLKPDTKVNIITSCRGFLLLMLIVQEQQLLFLWNPTTSQHKQIPKPPSSLPSISKKSYGFCYDESTDDYLLVTVNYKNDPFDLSSVEIFSLRTNSWQKLSLTSYQLPKITWPLPIRTGSFLNGAIHWLISGRDYAPESFLYSAKIIAFDITTKYVRQIATPSHDDDDDYLYYDLGVLGGCLALTASHMYGTKKEIEIWMMREYGVKSSWTKFISLSYQRSRIRYIWPLCFNKHGEILAMDDGGVGLSKWSDENGDQNGEIQEYLEFRGRLPRIPWILYTETLFSLPLRRD